MVETVKWSEKTIENKHKENLDMSLRLFQTLGQEGRDSPEASARGTRMRQLAILVKTFNDGPLGFGIERESSEMR